MRFWTEVLNSSGQTARATFRSVIRPGRLADEKHAGPAWHRLPVGLIFPVLILIAAALRLYHLNCGIDYDEAYSFLNFARRPLLIALADYHTTNNHLLNTAFMRLEYLLFGQREWALRLHVFAAGLGLVATVWRFGSRHGCAWVGLIAAALIAVSPLGLYYSTNARGYMWVAWMAVVLLGRAAMGAARMNPGDWLIAWLAAVVGLFAMPTMLYPIAAAIVLMLWRAVDAGLAARIRCSDELPAKREAQVGIASSVASVCWWLFAVTLAAGWLYAPGLVFRGMQAWRHPFVAPLGWSDWLGRFPRACWLGALSWSESPVGPAPVAAAAAAGAVVCIVAWFRHARSPSRPTRCKDTGLAAAVGENARDGLAGALLLVLLVTAVLLTVQRLAPPPRVLSFLLPFWALLAGVGVRWLAECAAWLWRRGQAKSRAVAVPLLSISVIAVLLGSGLITGLRSAVPGGPWPAVLVGDVTDRRGDRQLRVLGRSADQLWRPALEGAVEFVASSESAGDPLLVALPMDVPVLYYAARRRLDLRVNQPPGQLSSPPPQRGQGPGPRPRTVSPPSLWLIARTGAEPAEVIRYNLSLQPYAAFADAYSWTLAEVVPEIAIWRGVRRRR
jgi:hypothetical protein